MFTSKYVNLFILVIGLVIGFFLTRLFHSGDTPPPVAAVLQPEITKAKVAVATATYNSIFDSLRKVNTTLVASLTNTRTALTTAKTQSAGLQKQVLALLDNSNANSSLTNTADSCHCDTLQKTVSAFVSVNEHKDSLYESALSQSDSLVNTKEAALQITVKQKDFLSGQLDTALSKQCKLIREDLYYQQQYHKQKKKTWIGVMSSALLTAICSLLIHH